MTGPIGPERSPEASPPRSEFVAKLEARWEQGNFVCVGLDSDYERIPDIVKKTKIGIANSVTRFNSEIVDATYDLACAYKPNIAFYEKFGNEGLKGLMRTIAYITNRYPDIPVILDAKRADIGKTNEGYVHSAFEVYGADAITVNPYLGKEALKPFLDRGDKGIIILAKTSNPGSGEFQDRLVLSEELGKALSYPGASFDFEAMQNGTMPLYLEVAIHVARDWNINGNCGVVVGATFPHQLAEVRRRVGNMPLLIPGIGTQGGEVESTVNAGKDDRGWGMIVNSSSGIIFASDGEDFAEVARAETQRLSEEINQYRAA